ncbi:Uncharacterised protein [Mycobacteroides abscessus subsp. abscessus]|nr:Uncharacterised protein [Mycobacteroides abscessus subsp. abscessus]
MECCSNSWTAIKTVNASATACGNPMMRSGAVPAISSSPPCTGCFINPLKP